MGSRSCPVINTARGALPTGWAVPAPACSTPDGGSELHAAAGGPTSAPIYASIDDNPSYEQYKNQIVPYLRSWESVIGHQRTGVYANSKTIDWAVNDGLGSYFWQHNWGSPKGYTHPAAHLHQVEIDKRKVGGVGVDVNQILKPQFGQWA